MKITSLLPVTSIFLLVAMVTIFPAAFFVHNAAAASPSPSVIIVGAGMSGISAAKTLYESGIRDILILEGSSRMGGRMMKANFSGYTVEMGANWIFKGGPLPNPVAEMADKLELDYFFSDYSNITANTYKQEGGLYPKKLVEQVDRVGSASHDNCGNLSRSLSSKSKQLGKDIDMSILAAQRLFGKVPESPLEMVVDFYYNDFEDAEPPRVTSTRHSCGNQEMQDHGEESYFVSDRRGLEELVHYLARTFLDNNNKNGKGSPRTSTTTRLIHFNKVVKEIAYGKRSGVRVRTEDGSTYKAHYVIVSVSLGVLQTNLIQFTPKLPVWKRIAIDDFSMAIYTKIFLKFPYRFWPSGPKTEFFLYTHMHRGYYPFWQHLENEYPGSNILMVTVTADESRRVEQLSDEAIQAEAMAVLRKMFGEKIPDPENILVPRWYSDRFYKGCFTNWPPNYDLQRHSNLRAPIGPVYFTGEHTDVKYYGYVDGAYFAGRKTANDVIKCIKGGDCRG